MLLLSSIECVGNKRIVRTASITANHGSQVYELTDRREVEKSIGGHGITESMHVVKKKLIFHSLCLDSFIYSRIRFRANTT